MLAQATRTSPARHRLLQDRDGLTAPILNRGSAPALGVLALGKPALGVLALVKTYGPERVDAACQRGVTILARPFFQSRAPPFVRSSRPASIAPS